MRSTGRRVKREEMVKRRDEAETEMGPGSNGTWRLGKESAGRVRVQVEAPLDATVVIRGGEQPQVAIPLVAILEKPQHTPPQSPFLVSIEAQACPGIHWPSAFVTSPRTGSCHQGATFPLRWDITSSGPIPPRSRFGQRRFSARVGVAMNRDVMNPGIARWSQRTVLSPPTRIWSVQAPSPREVTYLR